MNNSKRNQDSKDCSLRWNLCRLDKIPTEKPISKSLCQFIKEEGAFFLKTIFSRGNKKWNAECAEQKWMSLKQAGELKLLCPNCVYNLVATISSRLAKGLCASHNSSYIIQNPNWPFSSSEKSLMNSTIRPFQSTLYFAAIWTMTSEAPPSPLSRVLSLEPLFRRAMSFVKGVVALHHIPAKPKRFPHHLVVMSTLIGLLAHASFAGNLPWVTEKELPPGLHEIPERESLQSLGLSDAESLQVDVRVG